MNGRKDQRWMKGKRLRKWKVKRKEWQIEEGKEGKDEGYRRKTE